MLFRSRHSSATSPRSSDRSSSAPTHFDCVAQRIIVGDYDLWSRVDHATSATEGKRPTVVLLKSVPPASARAEFGDEVVLVATSETELRTILYDLETEEPRRKRKAAVELDPELVAAAAERSVRFRTEEPLFEMGAFQAVSRELGARKRPADLLCKKAEASSPVVATATDPRRGKPDSVQLLPLFRCYSTDASECRARYSFSRFRSSRRPAPEAAA